MTGRSSSCRALTHHSGELGQELVEFAMILPLMLALLLGICEFGLLVADYNTVVNASREGARYAITQPYAANSGTCASGLGGVVGAACNLAVRLAPSEVSVTSTKSATSIGPTITVRVTYNARLLTGFVIEALGGKSGVNLAASSTMLFEQ